MIRVLAIDDEPLALQQLASYLGKLPFFELVDTCQSALDAMTVLDSQDVDALFIDINMPDLNGLDFVRSLNRPPMIVFTTAYQEYAVEGYKVDAVDYLLKPFGMGDVVRAADKVRRQYELLHPAELQSADDDDTIFVKSDYKVVRVLVRDILYVEGMSEYLRIHLAPNTASYTYESLVNKGNAKPLVALLSMKKMENRLPADTFMRVHKSYIINLRHIAEINRVQVVLDNGEEIPVGDSFRENLNQYVNRKFLGK